MKIPNLSLTQEKEEFFKLLKEIITSLNAKDIPTLKSKSKDLSEILNNFSTRKLSDIIEQTPMNDSPLSVLVQFYEPRNEGLFYLYRFFKYVNNLDSHVDEKKFDFYGGFFTNKLVPFYKEFPKQ